MLKKNIVYSSGTPQYMPFGRTLRKAVSVFMVAALVSLSACSNSGGTAAPESTSAQASSSGEKTDSAPAPANPTGIVLPAES